MLYVGHLIFSHITAVILNVCTLLPSLSTFHYQSSYLLRLLNAVAVTAWYAQLWNPSKRDNQISVLFCGLVVCLQPWAPCRVILLLQLPGKALQKRWVLHTNLIMAGLLLLFFFFFKYSLGGRILNCNINGITGWLQQSRFTVTQFPLCLVAPLRTEKLYCIYILSFTMSQFFHKLCTLRHLTSDGSPKCEWGHNLAFSV